MSGFTRDQPLKHPRLDLTNANGHIEFRTDVLGTSPKKIANWPATTAISKARSNERSMTIQVRATCAT